MISKRSKSYTVEAEFRYKGFSCCVLALKAGYRCGYVGVEKSHPWYGLNYRHGQNGQYNDKSSPVHLSKEIHGEITYSASRKDYPLNNHANLWWFGFDCDHDDDNKDLDLLGDVRESWPNDEGNHYNNCADVKYLDDVVTDVKKLAKLLEIHSGPKYERYLLII
jgi:hypothetical protein